MLQIFLSTILGLSLALSFANALPASPDASTTLERRAVAQCGLTVENAGDRICQPCKTFSPWAKTCTTEVITSCIRGRLVLSGKTCEIVCPESFYPDAANKVCLPSPTCSFDEFLTTDKKTCAKCKTLDSRALSCTRTAVKTCSNNRIGEGLKCVCKASTYESNGLCLPCGRLDSQALTCTGRNVITLCKAGFVPNAAGTKCECSAPATFRRDKTDGTSTCVPCSTFDVAATSCTATSVVCASGFKNDPSSPTKCVCSSSTDYRINRSDNTAECKPCAADFPYATSCDANGATGCGFGSTLNSDSKRCVCSGSQYATATECVDCGTIDPNAASCEAGVVKQCASAFLLTSDGCATCPANSVCDGTAIFTCTSTSLQLTDGSGSCVTCPTGATCDGSGETTCLNIELKLSDQSCTTCPPYTLCYGETSTDCTTDALELADGSCTACPPNFACDGTTSLTCAVNALKTANGCAPCPAQARCDGSVDFVCQGSLKLNDGCDTLALGGARYVLPLTASDTGEGQVVISDKGAPDSTLASCAFAALYAENDRALLATQSSSSGECLGWKFLVKPSVATSRLQLVYFGTPTCDSYTGYGLNCQVVLLTASGRCFLDSDGNVPCNLAPFIDIEPRCRDSELKLGDGSCVACPANTICDGTTATSCVNGAVKTFDAGCSVLSQRSVQYVLALTENDASKGPNYFVYPGFGANDGATLGQCAVAVFNLFPQSIALLSTATGACLGWQGVAQTATAPFTYTLAYFRDAACQAYTGRRGGFCFVVYLSTQGRCYYDLQGQVPCDIPPPSQ